MDSVGFPEVNPNDWTWVDHREYPGWRYPITLETFNSLGSIDTITMRSTKLGGSVKYPNPHRRGGPVQIVDHLMAFAPCAARNGCTVMSYKDEMLLWLVEPDQAYLVREVLTKPKFQAYCSVVDPTCPFSHRTSIIRVFECIAAVFTDWDPRCLVVQAELDVLKVPVLNGAYDLPRLFTLVDEKVKRITTLDTPIARNDRTVKQMEHSMGITSKPLLNEWKVSTDNRFTIMQALGKKPTHYEVFSEQIDAMRKGVQLTTKPPAMRQAPAVTHQAYAEEEYEEQEEEPIVQHVAIQRDRPDTPRYRAADGTERCECCGENMGDKSCEEWHALRQWKGLRKVAVCRFSFQQPGCKGEVYVIGLAKATDEECARFIASSTKAGYLRGSTPEQLSNLQAKVAAQRERNAKWNARS